MDMLKTTPRSDEKAPASRRELGWKTAAYVAFVLAVLTTTMSAWMEACGLALCGLAFGVLASRRTHLDSPRISSLISDLPFLFGLVLISVGTVRRLGGDFYQSGILAVGALFTVECLRSFRRTPGSLSAVRGERKLWESGVVFLAVIGIACFAVLLVSEAQETAEAFNAIILGIGGYVVIAPSVERLRH